MLCDETSLPVNEYMIASTSFTSEILMTNVNIMHLKSKMNRLLLMKYSVYDPRAILSQHLFQFFSKDKIKYFYSYSKTMGFSNKKIFMINSSERIPGSKEYIFLVSLNMDATILSVLSFF